MLAGASSDTLQGPIASLLLPGLAVWRVSHLFWAEDGPWHLVARLRHWAAGRGMRVFDCFYCLSLWVALPVSLLLASSVATWLVDWFALSAAAILLERITAPAVATSDEPP